MTIERRIVFSPKDLIVRLICKTQNSEGRECGAEVFVQPIERTHYGEYWCGQCGEQWTLQANSAEAHFIRFLRPVVRTEREDMAIVLEIKDPR